MEQRPISVTIPLGTFNVDCDTISETRMSNAIAVWSELGVSTINWTMADNSFHALSLSDLTHLRDNMIVARGLRSLTLHQYAAGLKETLPVSDDSDIFNEANWTL
jgi:(p)ppGpp synthase/HD superfamily hydrolase